MIKLGKRNWLPLRFVLESVFFIPFVLSSMIEPRHKYLHAGHLACRATTLLQKRPIILRVRAR